MKPCASKRDFAGRKSGVALDDAAPGGAPKNLGWPDEGL